MTCSLAHQEVFLQGSEDVGKGGDGVGVGRSELIISDGVDAIGCDRIAQQKITDGVHIGRASGLQKGTLQPYYSIKVLPRIAHYRP